MDNILISVYFMKCSHFNFKAHPDKVLFDEQEFEMTQNEGGKASKIVEKISKQQPLSKWKNPEVRPILCYWLDPIQSEIMNDSNPYQIIVGPASTGKTILIQLKVCQILQKGENVAVLIILPLEILKVKYLQFFDTWGFTEVKKLFILTVREDWKTVMLEHKPHVFIDELSAVESIDNNFLDEVLQLIKANQEIDKLIWLTFDYLQSFDILKLVLPQTEDKQFVERASKSHLLLVHRCTKKVFQVSSSYLIFSDQT